MIPALNEEKSLPLVLGDLPWQVVRRVVVADNGSIDRTAELAADAGAVVVPAVRRGYGSACLAGLAELRKDPPEVVVFLDGDYSDHPDELPLLVEPIVSKQADLVIGSRILGNRQRGALLPQARMGNFIACGLIRILYGQRCTDLGPFRAIAWNALESLSMEDPDFGWTAEMQVKAARAGLVYTEVPVSYRRRVGVSKITGTLRGTILAGYKILLTVFKYAFGTPRKGKP